MPKCTRKGCGKEFTEEENKDNVCQFHEGAPVFHEGLKGWSCCKKRVSDFDEFLQIPGCTFGQHSTEAPVQPAKEEKKPAAEAIHVTNDGVEVYGKQTPAPAAPVVSSPVVPHTPAEEKKVEEIVEEEDDESVSVAEGTTCKRRGCGHAFKDQETSRGPEAKCLHHPGAPIFHEGSKGWSCCNRRVLDFDEFLKIPGCKEGRHLFVSKNNQNGEELVDCRTDWYQTQTHVIFSIFAKNKEDTQVHFKENSIDVDIKMKGNKRYKKTFPLFQSIDTSASKFTPLSTKVEINLKKTSGISWAAFEPTDEVKTWTTFGVTGGGGTVGAKEMYYNADAPLNYTRK
ncbi:chord-domain-containing protein [Rhizopus microsporus var. microsporus]|uniref:Chord-domain-containing protein n=2 Tax=Rhizopus microsporus TaxID=58291 RepID=A0A2G4SJB6_RHIZD|nr:chord-domain-containing protein [Rhizopus microsporus ATCC 52813]ORE03297.1 chord-domain-containing protein [Rhizopus microsporus var. microsporus]PHZ08870.1 chord-domain-containing protein [Rhizopus microsporus ATCC 52813]